MSTHAKRGARLEFLAAAAALLLVLPALADDAPSPEPEGYRLEKLHAPTPATLKGATVLDTARTHEIWSKKEAVFIDALGHQARPADLPKEQEWREPPRRDIPGSIWLPGVGAGELTPAMQRHFENALARATSGDKTKPVVFYCRTYCWASWNAGKRALAAGYTQVLWYPLGADGWEKAGHPLEDRQPEPMQ
jgi:PQQ-dependent catabolism-associated CXXCW motif protein